MRTGRPAWLLPVVAVSVIAVGAMVVGLALIAPLWSQVRTSSAPSLPTSSATGQGTRSAPAGVRPGLIAEELCHVGEPEFRGSDSQPGRLNGGGLSLPLPTDLPFGDPARMPYAFDVALVDSPTDAAWAGVGAVRFEEPYDTTEQASGTVTACLARAYADSDLQVTEAAFVTIPGTTQAHERTGRTTRDGTTHDFRVLIADAGGPESLAVYVRVSRPTTAAADALTRAEAGLAAP